MERLQRMSVVVALLLGCVGVGCAAPAEDDAGDAQGAMEQGAASIANLDLGHFVSTDKTAAILLAADHSYITFSLSAERGTKHYYSTLDVSRANAARGTAEGLVVEQIGVSKIRVYGTYDYLGAQRSIDAVFTPQRDSFKGVPSKIGHEGEVVVVSSSDARGVTATVSVDDKVVFRGSLGWFTADLTESFDPGTGRRARLRVTPRGASIEEESDGRL